MILLDTDIMIDLLRGFTPAIEWLSKIDDEEIYLPGYVFMELIKGSKNKDEQNRIEKTLKDYIILWPSVETCNNAFTVFVKYHLSHGIGIIDSLIGQLSADTNISLCTFNVKHYEIIPGIKMIRPYKKY